jgi:murein DD-endopeptidase MepM/ murein hydrolase activator NlpD
MKILYPTSFPHVTQVFGAYNKVYTDNVHHGVDFRIWNDPERKVMACYDGKVVEVDDSSTNNWYKDGKFLNGHKTSPYGVHCIILHEIDGEVYYSLYAHLKHVHVYVGQHITAGQVVGEGGNTGMSQADHLHFELRKGENTLKHAINPADFFAGSLDNIPSWARLAMDWCARKRIMKAERADEPVTRAELAVVIKRLKDMYPLT